MGGEEQQHAAPRFPTSSQASAFPPPSRIPVIFGNGADRPQDKRRRTSRAIPWERWELWERSVKAWFSCLNSSFIYPPTLDVFKIPKYASIIHVN